MKKAENDELLKLAMATDDFGRENVALPMFQYLAQKGNAKAQNELGCYYEMGLGGLDVSIPEAIKWYEESANQGFAEAMDSLGSLFCKCEDPRFADAKRGVEWYQKAIKAGYSFSYVGLAECYEDGIYFEQDSQKAFDLYCKALETAEPNDKGFILLEIAFFFNKICQYDDALKYFKLALEEDYEVPTILRQIGSYYYFGWGVNVNYTLAFQYFRQSYDMGNKDAAKEMADCYVKGKGVEYDLDYAIELYKEAASNGNSFAYEALGDIFMEEDEDKAIAFYEEGAKLGNDECMYSLGYHYLWEDEDNKVQSSGERLEKAINWYIQGANLGNEFCQSALDAFSEGQALGFYCHFYKE